MDIWEVLEIQPTNEIKVIKRAYAKKLKITRPDENPEAFQDLYLAYKTAIEEASYWETDVTLGELLVAENDSLPTDQIATDDNYHQEEADRLLSLSRQLLTSHGLQRTPESWKFILDSSYILNDDFNWKVGLALLQLIQELSFTSNLSQQIGNNSLNYLNSIFNWKNNEYLILNILGDNYNHWFNRLNTVDSNITQFHKLIRGGKKLTINDAGTKTTSTIKRLLAWMIDICLIASSIFMLLAVFLLCFDFNIPIIYRNYFFIVFMFLYFWIFESYFQATIGKIIFNIKVVNELNEKITIGEGLARSAIFTSSILYKTCILTFIIDNEKLLSLIIPFAFALHLLTLILDNTTVDSSTNTKVINS